MLNNVWAQVIQSLREHMLKDELATWIAPLSLVPSRLGDGHVRIEGTKAIRKWAEEQYGDRIHAVLEQVMDRPLMIDWGTPRDAHHHRHDLNGFIEGASNKMALRAIRALCDNPTDRRRPLMHIWGPPGVGKTHLLVGLSKQLQDTAPDLKVRYVPGLDFVNQFIDALRHKAKKPSLLPQWQARMRSTDVLLLDDVHWLENKSATQDELFQLLSFLRMPGRSPMSQVIFASTEHTAKLPLTARVRDQLTEAVSLPVQMPSDLERCRIVHAKARTSQLALSDAQAQRIVQRMPGTGRQIESVIAQIGLRREMDGGVPLDALIESAVQDATGFGRVMLDPSVVDHAVCAHYNLQIGVLSGPSRTTTVARARHVAMYLTRECTQLSLSDIAKRYGRKSHTTVLRACGRVESQQYCDEVLQADVVALQSQLRRS